MSLDQDIPSSQSPSRTASVQNLRNAFLCVACFTTVSAPWMIGSVSVFTQKILLVSALLTFALGGACRLKCHLSPGARAAWKILRWSTVFGILFLGLLLVQAWNPSHLVEIQGNSWSLINVANDSGWPSSIAAPFDFLRGDWLPYKNAWRYLFIFSIGWCFSTGLALGLVERDDTLRFLRVLGINAAALAVVCIVHRLSGAKETLWTFSDTFDFTRSPVFFYKNHNGAYLAASLALVFALAAAETSRRWRLGWHVTAFALWVATVLVNSRAATGCATLWVVLYLGYCWKNYRDSQQRVHWGKVGALAGAGIIGAVALVFALGGKSALNRFTPALTSPIDFLQGGPFRSHVRELGWKLWGDRLVFGWGGGAYMYLFPENEQRVPEIKRHMFSEQPNLNRVVSPTVNCDWIEFGLEYGIVGVCLLVLAGGIPVLACRLWGTWSEPMVAFLLIGCGGIILHCWFDYILRNPAIMVLFTALLVSATRLGAKPPHSFSRRRHRSHHKRESASVSA